MMTSGTSWSTDLSARALPDRRGAGRIAGAILVCIVLLSNGWDAPKIIGGTIDPKSIVYTDAGDILRQIAFVLLFAGALGLSVFAKQPRSRTVVPAIFVPILVWCWLSVLWAADPEIALRRIAFTTLVIFMIALCLEHLSYSATIRSLLIGFGLLLVADWIAVALVPHAVHGPMEMDRALVGNWRGLHNNKNEAGAFCALAAILFIHEAVRQRSYLVCGSIAAFAIAFLYQSQSKTSLALAGAALVVGACVDQGYRSSRVLKIQLLALGLVVVPTAVAYFEELVDVFATLVADPASLSGRTQIWPALIEYAQDHPLLGAGYGSFWGYASKMATVGRADWITRLFTAHNGYLELLVQVGAIGLALAVVLLILLPAKRLISSPLGENASRALLCAVLLFGWLRDLFETSLLDRANPTWTMAVIAYCLLYRSARTCGSSSILAIAPKAPGSVG